MTRMTAVTRALRIASLIWLAVLSFGRPAAAQAKYDIGVLTGWLKTSSAGDALTFHVGPNYEVTAAREFWRTDSASLAIELPFFAQNSISTKTPGAQLPREYASFFLTPGVRVHVNPDRVLSWFAMLGGGYARYSESKLREDGGPNPAQRDTNAGALAFGVGLDVNGGSWLSLRAEFRDIMTGARQFSVPVPDDRVHNIIMALGAGIRF